MATAVLIFPMTLFSARNINGERVDGLLLRVANAADKTFI